MGELVAVTVRGLHPERRRKRWEIGPRQSAPIGEDKCLIGVVNDVAQLGNGRRPAYPSQPPRLSERRRLRQMRLGMLDDGGYQREHLRPGEPTRYQIGQRGQAEIGGVRLAASRSRRKVGRRGRRRRPAPAQPRRIGLNGSTTLGSVGCASISTNAARPVSRAAGMSSGRRTADISALSAPTSALSSRAISSTRMALSAPQTPTAIRTASRRTLAPIINLVFVMFQNHT